MSPEPPRHGRLGRSLRAAAWLATLRKAEIAAAVAIALLVKPANLLAAPGYVGSASCTPCHADESERWQASLHAWAMKAAGDPALLSRFDGDERMLRGGRRIRPFEGKGTRWIEISGTGDFPGPFRVFAALGRGTLEQFLTRWPRGRIQALPVGFDTKTREWFDLFETDRRSPTDWGHWTGRGMAANSQCLFCHTTGYRKGYAAEADTFATSWAEAGVGCEGCHGPGRGHPGPGDPYTGRPREMLRIEACAPCHSRRAELSLDYAPGDRFLDHFDPELLESNAYHADGQVDAESYEWGSFLQSRMYGRGVTCQDCHDPHSGRLQAEGDALCLRCHEPRLAERHHTRHRGASAASRCVACHMPETVYMQRDPRRDHSFSLPDPALASEIGAPDACTRCHADEGAAWAGERVDTWYPAGVRIPRRAATRALKAGRERRPEAIEGLFELLEGGADPVRRASAARLLGHYARDPAVARRLPASADDADPLVRAGVMSALGSGGQALPTVVLALLKGVRDPLRLVRIRAGYGFRGVDPHALPKRERQAVARALSEWEKATRAMADWPGAQFNMGVYHADAGRNREAEAAYLRALNLDPSAVPPRQNLAMLYATTGRPAEAERELEDILRREPAAAGAAFSLGLLYGELERYADAVSAFERCLSAQPDYARAAYNLGLSRVRAGQVEAALADLERAADTPGSRASAARVLASLYRQLGRLEDAARWTERERARAGSE